MAKNPIGFSAKTLRNVTKINLKKAILSAAESNSEMRAEIRSVFHKANRRIQNIEQAEIVSPAVVALNKGDIKGFSKFYMTGWSWEELKIEYGRAVAFLQQPTSTLTGTREYSDHIKTAYDLSDDEFNLMQDKLMGKIASVSDERFLEQYLMQYKDFTGELEREAEDVSSQIESDAVSLANALDEKLNAQAESAAEQVQGTIDKIIANFEKFGLV